MALLGIVFGVNPAIAQNLWIKGKVTDVTSQEPLSYANVVYYTDISKSMKVVIVKIDF